MKSGQQPAAMIPGHRRIRNKANPRHRQKPAQYRVPALRSRRVSVMKSRPLTPSGPAAEQSLFLIRPTTRVSGLYRTSPSRREATTNKYDTRPIATSFTERDRRAMTWRAVSSIGCAAGAARRAAAPAADRWQECNFEPNIRRRHNCSRICRTHIPRRTCSCIFRPSSSSFAGVTVV